MAFTLYLSLGLLAISVAFLVQSIRIYQLEQKLTKITVNHHGRIKNLEERVKKLEENFEKNSFENISLEI